MPITYFHILLCYGMLQAIGFRNQKGLFLFYVVGFFCFVFFFGGGGEDGGGGVLFLFILLFTDTEKNNF